MPSVSVHSIELKKSRYHGNWSGLTLEEAGLTLEKLEEIRSPEAINALLEFGVAHSDTRVSSESIEAIRRIDEGLFVDGLKSKNAWSVGGCAKALGEIGDRKVLPELMKLSGHEHPTVNEIIKKSIKKIQEAERARKDR